MKSGEANPDLELRRLKAVWWWTDPTVRIMNHVDQREVEGAKTWELIRRTQNYPIFYRSFKAYMEKVQGKLHLVLQVQIQFRERLGDVAWLISCGADPKLTWIELSDDARKSAERIRLPRQMSPADVAAMLVSLCRVKRSGTKQKILPWGWEGGTLKLMIPATAKILSPSIRERRYVAVVFNVLLGEDTLNLQFDQRLQHHLGLPTSVEMLKRLNVKDDLLSDPGMLESAFDRYVRNERTAREIRYPKLWKLEPILAQDRSSEVRVTPSKDQPYAVCWIPARYDLKTVREIFHNQVRPENLKPKIDDFQKVWKGENVRTYRWTGESKFRKGKIHPVFDKKTIEVYPQLAELEQDLRVRRAGKVEWGSICAYDHSVGKLNSPVTDYLFECYRTESQKTALSHPEKDKLLKIWRDGRRAVIRRLSEIDEWLGPKESLS